MITLISKYATMFEILKTQYDKCSDRSTGKMNIVLIKYESDK